MLWLPFCAHNVLHHSIRMKGLGGSDKVVICTATLLMV